MSRDTNPLSTRYAAARGPTSFAQLAEAKAGRVDESAWSKTPRCGIRAPGTWLRPREPGSMARQARDLGNRLRPRNFKAAILLVVTDGLSARLRPLPASEDRKLNTITTADPKLSWTGGKRRPGGLGHPYLIKPLSGYLPEGTLGEDAGGVGARAASCRADGVTLLLHANLSPEAPRLLERAGHEEV